MKIQFNHEGRTLPDSHCITDDMLREVDRVLKDFADINGDKLSVLSEMMNERLDQRVILMFAVEKLKEVVEMYHRISYEVDDLMEGLSDN